MREWLEQNFIRVGVIALVVDALTRFYAQIGLDWLREHALNAEWTFDQVLKLTYVSTAMDIAASVLWGLFSLGFACRVLAEFRRQ